MDPRYEKYNLSMKDGCLAVGIEAYPPYTIYNNKTRVFRGSCLILLDMIMERLGFCYSLIKSPNGLWGKKQENGTWTGLVGLGQSKEAEVISCPVGRTYERFQVLDFSEAVISSDYSIIYPRPQITANFMGFVMPFNGQTWAAICATFLMIMSITYIIRNYSPIGRIDAEKDSTWNETKGFKLTNWWVYRGLFGQPTLKLPSGLGGRMLMTFWLLLVLNLMVVYKCNLKALLIVPKVSVPFNSLAELVNQRQFQWSFLDGSMVPLYFKPAFEEDPNSVMGKGWSRKGELYSNVEQMASYVLEKHLACIEISSKVIHVISDDFSETGVCRYAAAGQRLITADLSFAFRKGSAMLEWMNRIILRLREAGILHKILFGDSENATHCYVPPGKEGGLKLRAFDMEDFMGMFFILFAGWIVATLVFVGELVIKRKSKTAVNQEDKPLFTQEDKPWYKQEDKPWCTQEDKPWYKQEDKLWYKQEDKPWCRTKGGTESTYF